MSSPYVNRAGWGARSPNGSGNSLTGNGKGYCLHWEGPEMGSRPHSECDNLMRSIQNYHMDSQGWSDIAYNLAVCEHGTIYEGRGKEKGSGANGTSDANHNYQSICALVGENDPQPEALLDGIADAVAMIRGWGAGSAQKGHRDFVSTACCGNSLYNKMKDGRFDQPGSGEDDDMPSAEEVAAAVWRYDQNGAASQAWSYQRDGAKKVWQYDQDDAHKQAWSYQLAIERIEQAVADLTAKVDGLAAGEQDRGPS